MGRTDKQKATFPFNGKPMEFYRPNDAQGAALVLAQNSKGSKAIVRFFQIFEALTVKASDWEKIEEMMIAGDVEVKDFGQLLNDIGEYDWEPTEDGE